MIQSSPASRIQDNLQQLFKAKLKPGNAYIKFKLTSEVSALLSMTRVEESKIVAAKTISPLPNMPPSVIGMMNSRDRVFCVFDLARLLSLSAQPINTRQYQIIVLKTVSEPSILIGLATKELQGIIRLPAEQIQTSDHFNSNLAPFMTGVMQQEKTIVPILDLERIIEALQTPQK